MKAKSDCTAVFSPGPGALAVRVESSVGTLFGRAIEAAARRVAAEFGVATGGLAIDDNGALDHVVAARVEAALRGAGFRSSRVAAPDAAVRGPAAERPAGGTAPGPARRRSRLYLPGNQPDLFANAGLFGADCLILDLEDSVPTSRKEEARILVRRTLESHPDFFGRAEIAVRINPLAGLWGAADLAELSRTLPQAILLPKCESQAEVQELDRQLDRLESALGDRYGRTVLMPILETARGVLAAATIASASDRVAALCFGAEDFAADIGVRRTAAGTESLAARQAIVLAAKAAGVQALDSVFSDTGDAEGFAAYCAASRAMGFDGVGVIHPRQIAVANRAFSPTAEEIEEARAVVAALAEAESAGSGVASLKGKMIDAPVALRARRIVAAEERKGG
jgi:citrate lyase subunit beta/citryl-CoA lyase